MTCMESNSSGLAPDCAMTTLEETFSPRCRHGRTGSFPAQRHAKSIHDCPVEVLVMFFTFIYIQETTGGMCYTPVEWRDFDIKPPSLFPYAIAAVCSFWKDVISSVPQFWTRVMIFLDSPTIPQSVIASQLTWSHDLPLDIIVTRRNLDHAVDSQCEQRHVSSLMETVINPHIARLKKLHFNVGCSSSLPLFPDDFHGTATQLECLRLHCKEDDGGSTHSSSRYKAVPVEPQYPALRELELDGRNYYNGCRRRVPWATKASNVMQLTISHYKPRAGELFPAYAFLLFIAPLRNLCYLTINDITLCPGTHHPIPGTSLILDSLELSDLLDFLAIDEMFQVLGHTAEVTFTRCAVGNMRGLGDQRPLELTEIDADQDLVPLLRGWHGSRLNVDRCPCFNDVVLDMMGTRQENGEYVCAPGAYLLFIFDCPNFSVAALKRLVTAREFESIRVCGGAPVFSVEDVLWFEQKVQDFGYL